MVDILQMSAAEIARQIRNRVLSPVEVVEAHIRRIEQANPHINAVITPLFAEARQGAQAAQQRLEAQGTDNLPPLFGVPITIKDSFPVAGARFTGGSWHRRDQVATEDAVVVRKLREAGAIILGKTNLPDMCWLPETSNPIFGQTNNPHRLTHTAGGSSGGEGAIIAAGGSPLGIGSDIAGSVRIPAAANGLVALKPTGGRIATNGHVPAALDKPLDTWLTAGPMARRVEDLALALTVLSETPVQDYRQIDLQGRRCLVYIHNHIIPVRRPVVEAVTTAAEALRTSGMTITHDERIPMRQALVSYLALMTQHGNPSFRAALGGGQPYNLLREIGKHGRGRGEITPRVLFFADGVVPITGMVGRLLGLGGFEKLQQLKEQFHNIMGAGDVLLTPLLITPVPRHGWTWWMALAPTYTLMFNALDMPAVVVPIGWDNNGLPLAVQVAARPGADEVALAVAADLERQFGGWKLAQP